MASSTTDGIIFLDIDGVVMKFDEQEIGAPARVAVRAARDAGFRLILHSTWRHGMLPHAEQLFEDAGLPLDGCVCCDTVSKRSAIVKYLDEQYGGRWPANLIVVDDDPIEPIDGVAIVRVSPKHGLHLTDIANLIRE